MFANKLKEILEKEGIRKSDLQYETGLSGSTVYKLASGKREASLTTKNLIVKKLNEIIGENRYSLEDIFPTEINETRI